MSYTLPKEGTSPKDETGESSPRNSRGKSSRKNSLSAQNSAPGPKKGSGSRPQQAINDAQQSLHSLLNPQADDTQPQIISQSGASRNHTRGRIAAPLSIPAGSSRTRSGSGQLIEGGTTGTDPANSDHLLAVVPGTTPLYEDGEIHDVPQTRVQRGLALATDRLEAARKQAELLIYTPEQAGSLGVDVVSVHTSRRAASKWATRYATHIVILLVVGALVAFGGLKTLTVQGAYQGGLQAVDTYTGTDHIEDDHEHESANGKPGLDSMDFEIALPRTELGGADAAANSRIIEPVAGEPGQVAEPVQPPPPVAVRTDVVAYTVGEGDTLDAIAAEFKVMPETILGSNGIYDAEEALQVGRVLQIPPIDGMYYVPNEGDTVDTIARRFQVDPKEVMAYAPNNMTDGVVKPGKPIVVPGGMMPQREVAIDYSVQRGDTLKGVAARYGVDVPTLLHSNDIPDPDNLQIGSTLRVLPVSGLEYKVKKGDNILAIAERFGVTPQMILDYSPNHLTTDSVLQIDQVIMVPGGSPEQVIAASRIEPASRGAERPAEPSRPESVEPSNKPAAAKPAAPVRPKPTAKPKPEPKPANPVKSGTGRFVWPVNGTITQYFSSRHNGLDIAIRAGTPIHAADSGKVIWSGWRTDGLGYCVMIDHLNGLTTVYGHMIRQPSVYVGQYVSRGQVIGNIGSTGRSTGPHVHFMVKSGAGRNYRNPLVYLGR
jgi:murein DD-endopeptidase MepM/ murein hydrolase activator NlpD